MNRNATRKIAAGTIVFFLVWILNSKASTASAHIRTSGSGATVRIGVLSLFHSGVFRLTAVPGDALVLRVGDQCEVLDRSLSPGSVLIQISTSNVVVSIADRRLTGPMVTVTARDGRAVDFILSIPNKITRRYRGTLEIKPKANSLTAIVTMDLETAVASVVAAETLEGTPLEALRAQAIATRSYLLAGANRHTDFDYCDTTHCQFLREPPATGSPVETAVATTLGLVLAYDATPFPAMYTRSCGGRTKTPQQLGLNSSPYPYYSVDCSYCRTHPAHWTSHLSLQDATTLVHRTEALRLSLDRRLGWDTVPSNDFAVKQEGDRVVLEGKGYGHGIGLCQAGARAMAAKGATFHEILLHYYPNTSIERLSDFGALAHRNRDTATNSF
jgi:stage II sporulation protein D